MPKKCSNLWLIITCFEIWIIHYSSKRWFILICHDFWSWSGRWYFGIQVSFYLVDLVDLENRDSVYIFVEEICTFPFFIFREITRGSILCSFLTTNLLSPNLKINSGGTSGPIWMKSWSKLLYWSDPQASIVLTLILSIL